MTNVKMTKIQTMNSINITHGKLKTGQALCSDKTWLKSIHVKRNKFV